MIRWADISVVVALRVNRGRWCIACHAELAWYGLHNEIRGSNCHCVRVPPRRFDELAGTSVFGDIAGRACFQRETHDHWVIVHAKYDDAGLDVMRSDAADKRQAGKAIVRKGETHHYHIRTILLIECVSAFEVVGGQDWLNPRISKNARASL